MFFYHALNSIFAQIFAIAILFSTSTAFGQSSGTFKGTDSDRPSACTAAKDKARSELGGRVATRCPGGVGGTRFDANVQYTFSSCDCQSTEGRTTCAVDAEATCRGTNASATSSDGQRSERSFVGTGFSKTTACDEAKNKAGSLARSTGKSVKTGSCECESSNNGPGGVVHSCRVDAVMY